MNSRGAKDLLHVHPFHCLYGCHSERLAIDEALHTVAVLKCFLCLCEGIFRLVFEKCYKTTRVALRKALVCLACHPRVHQAVSVRHTFKGDLGLLREQCYLRFYTSKYRQLFFKKISQQQDKYEPQLICIFPENRYRLNNLEVLDLYF